MRIDRGALIVSIVAIALGSFMLALSLRFPFGTQAQPGPGFYSLLVSALMILAAIGCIVEIRLRPSAALADFPGWTAGLRLAALLAGLAGYVLIVHFLGHLGASFLLTAVTLFLLEPRRPGRNLAFAAAFALASWYLFVELLDVQLPRSELLEWVRSGG